VFYVFQTPVPLIANADNFVLKQALRVTPTPKEKEEIQERRVLLYKRSSYTYGVFWAPNPFDYTKIDLLQTADEKKAIKEQEAIDRVFEEFKSK
jgi:hypothetical protein